MGQLGKFRQALDMKYYYSNMYYRLLTYTINIQFHGCDHDIVVVLANVLLLTRGVLKIVRVEYQVVCHFQTVQQKCVCVCVSMYLYTRKRMEQNANKCLPKYKGGEKNETEVPFLTH